MNNHNYSSSSVSSSSSSSQSSKLKYRIVFCSGEDEKHPVTQLYSEGNSTKGWQSQKFTEYPLEIIIQLDGYCTITQIQILSHQSKIATKIEIFCGLSSNSLNYQLAQWTRLGYLSLDNNSRTNYKARELKTVHINAGGQFLKFIVHKNFVNEHNLYSQVGIISLNVLGFPSSISTNNYPVPVQSASIRNVSASSSSSTGSAISSLGSASFEEMDYHIAKKIKELISAKLEAADIEDFALCSQIKQSIHNLQEVSTQIVALEKSKKVAVSREDYDTAAAIKYQIDQIKIEALKSLPYYPSRDDTDLEQLLYSRKDINTPPRRQRIERNRTKSSDDIPNQIENSKNFYDHPSLPSSSIAQERPIQPMKKEETLQRSRSSHEVMEEREKSLFKNSISQEETKRERGKDRDSIAIKPKKENESRKSKEYIEPKIQEPKISIEDRPLPTLNKKPINFAGDFSGEKDAYPVGFDPSSLQAPKDSIRKRNEKTKSKEKNTNKGKQEEEQEELNSDQEENNSPIRAYRPDPADERKPKRNGNMTYEDLDDQEEPDEIESKSSTPIPSKPEPLPIGKQKEVEPYLAVFGEDIVLRLYSKTWQLREEGAKNLLRFIQESNGEDAANIFNTSCQLLTKVFSDKLVNVYYLGLKIFENLLEHLGKELKKNQVQSAISSLVQVIVDKTGDSNQKTRENSSDTFFVLTQTENIGLSFLLSILFKKPKKTTVWRPLAGKLELLIHLIPQFGLSEENNVDRSISKEQLFAFILPTFENPSVEVRNLAVTAITECYKLEPKYTLKKIEGLKSQIKETLEKNFKENPKSTKSQSQLPSKQNQNKSDNQNKPKEISRKIVNVEPTEEEDGPLDVCQFCGMQDESFEDEKVLDLHYMENCRMLIECYCEQVIEITALTDHLLKECDKKTEFKFCSRCGEAIHIDFWSPHQQKECEPLKDATKFVRCPLCKEDIPGGKTINDSLRQHIINNCLSNDRNSSNNHGE